MTKYINKPTSIEAVKWNGKETSEITDWVKDAMKDGALWRWRDIIKIKTLEGIKVAYPGDYIVQDINGMIYPCKPDVFESIYYDENNTDNISDGYHTFGELYNYRKLYNAAWFNELAKGDNQFKVTKSKRHSDGELCFGGGWFIVKAELPTGQISNHYELKDWDLFKCPEVDKASEWDGYTPEDVANRIEQFIIDYQKEC